ncbi:MAG: serine hydrolase, partial [Bryobacteraceae bacterium]
DELPLAEADKVPGSGILGEFSPGVRLRLRDLVHLMIVVSDNTATNLILDRFPPAAINARLASFGLAETRSLRKVLGGSRRAPAGDRYGIGVTTAREMVLLLEKLHRGQIVSPAASAEMIEILKRQQYKDGIGRKLRQHPVASKSGTLDRLRSDAGLVFTPGGPIALAITVDDLPATDYSPDNRGLLLIAELARLVVEGLAK